MLDLFKRIILFKKSINTTRIFCLEHALQIKVGIVISSKLFFKFYLTDKIFIQRNLMRIDRVNLIASTKFLEIDPAHLFYKSTNL